MIALKRLGMLLYTNEVLIIFEHKVKNKIDSPVKIVYATQENLPDILEFQNAVYLQIFRGFLEDGDRGYLGYLDGKCVHRSWVVQEPGKKVSVHELLNFRLKENEIFIHYCETANRARGKNIYPAVLSRIVEDFQGKRTLICTNIRNPSSIRGIEKAGFEEVSRVRIVAILGIVFKFYSGQTFNR